MRRGICSAPTTVGHLIAVEAALGFLRLRPRVLKRGSPRACATKLPTLVSQGPLFVWPDENGFERELKLLSLQGCQTIFTALNFSTVTIQRDLFYGYDTLMENVSDPSHIDFAHHKVTGRGERAKTLPFKLEDSGPWGFAGASSGCAKMARALDVKQGV